MKTMPLFIIMISALFISSCGTMPGMSVLIAKREAAKLRPTYDEFQELCKGENLPKLREPLAIRGYLTAATFGRDCDRDGWDSIKKGKFEFYECYEESITNYDQLKEGTIYRYELTNKDNNQCPINAPISDKYVEKYSKEISDGYCLVKKKVINPNSKYAKLYETGYIDNNSFILNNSSIDGKDEIIGFSGYVIIDISTSKLVSVLNRKYTYFPFTDQKYINYKCSYETDHKWYVDTIN